MPVALLSKRIVYHSRHWLIQAESEFLSSLSNYQSPCLLPSAGSWERSYSSKF